MGGQSVLSELFVVLWVSTVEGCPLSRVPLCNCMNSTNVKLFLFVVTPSFKLCGIC